MYSKELIIKADFDEIVSQKLFATQTDLKRIIHGKIAKKKKFIAIEGSIIVRDNDGRIEVNTKHIPKYLLCLL